MITTFRLNRLEHGERFPGLWHPAGTEHADVPLPDEVHAQGKPEALELLKKLPERGLAIVGTRHPQGRSLQHLQQTIQRLAGSGLVIVSGFARGIDAAAHESALQARLPTIGILGSGFDHPYPEENSELRKAILESGGLLLSEYLPDVPPQAAHFLNRNRLIAAWASAVWIVEASYRSGALNTARWARDFHRTCFTTPCFPGDGVLAGNQILLDRDHASALWGVHSLGQVWLELAARPRRGSRRHAGSEDPGAENQDNASRNPERTDEEILARQVGAFTWARGGADVHELLEWTLGLGWSPQRYYLALQNSLITRLLVDVNGLLLKNSAI
ncbi:MAG: DNA-protecting protein DprA [Methylotenera sp.]|nr:DNA-protecting protein DprA [Oligoflexia bacterium]